MPGILRPRGLVLRLTLVLAAALAVQFAGNLLLGVLQNRQVVTAEKLRQFARQLDRAGRVAVQVDPVQRSRRLADMDVAGMSLNWVPRTVIADATPVLAELARTRARLNEAAPGLARRDVRLSLSPSPDGRRDLLGALKLDDGSFVTFRIHPLLGSSPSLPLIASLHLLLAVIVLAVALMTIRTLVEPLEALARAADMTGQGRQAEFPIHGPSEVRRVAIAFGAMQARLLRMLEDHSQALIAVSHDLRTPIQRMRLRAGLLTDAAPREEMAADLADMERFIASVTAFIDSGIDEEARLVDLAAIVMTIVDNAADTGARIDYDGPDVLDASLKPTAIKRTLGNLLENACRHANHIRVVLRAGNPIRLTIEDDGPGIPVERREAVFLPFHRFGSGGSGLGLSIVRNAVARLGGEVTLGSSDMGGLAVTIELPDTREEL